MAFIALLLVIQYIVLLLLVGVHDAAQSWAAFRLGDPSSQQTGRMTLNPAAHFDAFGMLLFPLISFYFGQLPLGWGRPVGMMYRNFRRKDGEVLAVLAGPGAQLAVSLAMLIIFLVLKHTIHGFMDLLFPLAMISGRIQMVGMAGLPGYFPLLLVVYYGMVMGVLLAVFNLLPVPFLDGGKVLSYFLPYNAARTFNGLGTWFMIGFFFLGGYAINFFMRPVLAVYFRLLTHL